MIILISERCFVYTDENRLGSVTSCSALLLYCQKYELERGNLLQQLRKHNVFGVSVKTLLGGSAQHYNRRRSIYAAL